ncbi:hypothetical protein ACWDXT_34890, partial [Streptomyces sp. NPDC003236]
MAVAGCSAALRGAGIVAVAVDGAGDVVVSVNAGCGRGGVFLSGDWDAGWGGTLYLGADREVPVVPAWNRTVIFACGP